MYYIVTAAGHCGLEGEGTRTIEGEFNTLKEAEEYQDKFLEEGSRDPCSVCGAPYQGWVGICRIVKGEDELSEFMEED